MSTVEHRIDVLYETVTAVEPALAETALKLGTITETLLPSGWLAPAGSLTVFASRPVFAVTTRLSPPDGAVGMVRLTVVDVPALPHDAAVGLSAVPFLVTV